MSTRAKYNRAIQRQIEVAYEDLVIGLANHYAALFPSRVYVDSETALEHMVLEIEHLREAAAPEGAARRGAAAPIAGSAGDGRLEPGVRTGDERTGGPVDGGV